MNFLSDFGVQPILLIAQVVNFLVLLFILKKLLYKPILKVLEKRKEIIAQSLKNAEEIEKKLQKTDEENEKKLAKAAKNAEDIINDAKESANQIIAQSHQKAARDIEVLFKKGEDRIRLERVKMQDEIKAELSETVVLALKKIISSSLDSKKQKEMVDFAIKNFKNYG